MALSPTILSISLLPVVHLLVLSIYRLLLHPLARTPGPKIAALTGWYEFYWDCPQKGRYFLKIQEMHRQYGPIVRISPWEVHIDDPAYFDIFYSNKKLDKDAWFYRLFGDNGAAVGTSSWEEHKARRGAMAKFFSAANVAKLEPKVMARVQKLLDRVEEHRLAGKVVAVSHAYRCYATDVIADYAAPLSRDFLSSPDFAAAFNGVQRSFSSLMPWQRHIPIVFPIMMAVPKALIARMDPSGASMAVIEHQEGLLKQAQTVIDNGGQPQSKESPTVLDAIYTSEHLPLSDKTLPRMLAETQAILGAGTETTANTLSVLTYHVLSQPSTLSRLKSELQHASQSQHKPEALMDFRTLERLPYLSACVRESLRLATGVSSRLPRINRFAPTVYITPSGDTYTYPPGTVISMSLLDLHYNPSIFSSPTHFRPERWLDAQGEELVSMERAFAPFGRGARGCVGLELAREEILLAAGNFFGRFELGLWETGERDVRMEHDFFAPFARVGSRGVRVRVM